MAKARRLRAELLFYKSLHGGVSNHEPFEAIVMSTCPICIYIYIHIGICCVYIFMHANIQIDKYMYIYMYIRMLGSRVQGSAFRALHVCMLFISQPGSRAFGFTSLSLRLIQAVEDISLACFLRQDYMTLLSDGYINIYIYICKYIYTHIHRGS